jgi:hypothetical protein
MKPGGFDGFALPLAANRNSTMRAACTIERGCGICPHRDLNIIMQRWPGI